MIEVGTMMAAAAAEAAAAAAEGPSENRESNRETSRRSTFPLPSSSAATAALTTEPGATVFIGGEVQESRESNGYALTSRHQGHQSQQRQQRQQAAHVVKIKINPDDDKNGKVISTVRLTLDENNRPDRECPNGAVVVPASVTKRIIAQPTESGNNSEDQQRTCLRISVAFATGTVHVGPEASANASADRNGNGESSGVPNSEATCNGTGDGTRDANVHETAAVKSDSASSTSNYFCNPCRSPVSAMVTSSGQCSPSDTLDSGTCSDLDGTPPPLPKKKNANGNKPAVPRKPDLGIGNLSIGSLTSSSSSSSSNDSGSGAEIDSDDNESNISCDSLNGTRNRRENPEEDAKQRTVEDEGCWDVAGHSAAELRSRDAAEPAEPAEPVDGVNGRTPVVRECTYEERKLEQARLEQESAAADFYANYNRSNGTKYLYDDDRFYKFHVNELRSEDEEQQSGGEEPAIATSNKDSDECFAGYKLLDREAIRSAKGTVRGVKNRVRAGIATFLQKPSAKDYKAKDGGKVVVYTTTSGIIRSSYYNCIKVKQILRTHMAKYEERDLFRSMEHQTELKDRLNCSTIELPQLFIDGQYIGDVETVDRLNETGELRRLLKPYKVETKISFAVCALCGGFRMLLCEQCNGSKRSVFRNGFTTEFVGLRCMKCNEVGLVPCFLCDY